MSELLVADRPSSLSVPWRDPHTVPAAEITSYIRALERACIESPASADLRTVLGIAHAVNHDVVRSLDALEAAVLLDPDNFWASLKYAEIHYRLRALTRAEELTMAALNLATNAWQLSLARKQLQEVRTLKRNCTRNLSWKAPILGPVVTLSALLFVVGAVIMWR